MDRKYFEVLTLCHIVWSPKLYCIFSIFLVNFYNNGLCFVDVTWSRHILRQELLKHSSLRSTTLMCCMPPTKLYVWLFLKTVALLKASSRHILSECIRIRACGRVVRVCGYVCVYWLGQHKLNQCLNNNSFSKFQNPILNVYSPSASPINNVFF